MLGPEVNVTRFSGGSRGPLPRGTNPVLVGKALQLLNWPGVLAGWIPAFAGKAPVGVGLREASLRFLHTLFRRESEGKICRLHAQARFLQRVVSGKVRASGRDCADFGWAARL